MNHLATPIELEAAGAAFSRDVPATFNAAQWIWDDGEPHPRNAWRLFRREIDLDTVPAGASVRITGDTRYVLHVNGQRVGQGPVRGFPWRWMVDTWDIQPFLRPGPNVIGVLVLHFGVSTFVDIGNRGGMIAEMDFDGEVVGTDQGWKVTTPAGHDPRSNRLSCQLGFTEIIDAAAFPVGWDDSGFDDSTWATATIVERASTAWPTLVERDIPHLAETVVRPTHVERLAAVRPFAHTATIDLRNHLDPASVGHANHIAYAAYVVTLLRVSTEGDVTVAIPWSRFSGFAIDGAWHDRAGMTVGPGSQRSVTMHLDTGDHWLVIEVVRADHGDGFQVALDGGVPGSVSFASPYGAEAETPFATIRCGLSGHPMAGYAPAMPAIPESIRTRARAIASAEEFAAIEGDVTAVPAALVSPVDLFTLVSQPRERTELPIPAALQDLAAGQPVTIAGEPERDIELIVDFGREFSGFLSFELTAPAGVTIDAYGFEYLRGDHREDTERLDNSLRYVTRAGRQHYTSPTRRGLRFLQLTIRGLASDAQLQLHKLAMIESHFPVSQVGTFRCSDARLDAIWHLARRTVLACMEDTWVDCPAYEQTYWVGDAYNSARFATPVFGAEALTERCLRLVAGSVRQEPYLASQVPSGWVNVIPNWTFLWVMTARSHWRRTGDSAFAVELLPSIQAALSRFTSHLNDDGLLEIAAWNLLDWAPMDQPNEGVVTHQNVLMVIALDAAAELAEAAGEDASRFRAHARALREAINAHLWSDDANGYIDAIHADGVRSVVCSVQVHMFALLAGVAEGERAARAQAVLTDPPEGWVRIGSPWMSAFLYDALADLGRTADAVEDIRRNYGMMLDHGATTCWEVYPASPVATAGHQLTRSHCHAWSAAPAAFLPERVLGIRGLEPGWRTVLVAPEPCGLEWADGSVPLPGAGRIDASWRMDGHRMRLEITAPAGIAIDARLPNGVSGEILVNGESLTPALH